MELATSKPQFNTIFNVSNALLYDYFCVVQRVIAEPAYINCLVQLFFLAILVFLIHCSC